MRTQLWIKRCIGALVTSATVVAIIGIVQYALGAVSNQAWLDTNYFFDIKGRVVSVFDNPNILAIYLIMILPFALYMMISATARRAKLLGAISVGSVMICIVLTWSRGAWIAAILSVMLFLLIYSKKTFRYMIFGTLFIPFISLFLPQSVIRRFTSIGNLSDSSTLYRVYTWKGSLRLIDDHLFSGIGYGTNAYQEMYPQYAYAGIEAAEHSHSLILQILVGTGIIGLVAFVTVMFLFTQMNLEHIRDTKDASGRLIANSAFCSIIAALIFGLFDFTWYNYRIFFLFWVIVAISCACIRVCNDEVRRHSVNVS
jgi:O-antigen ligase